jgi:hypothetical protein
MRLKPAPSADYTRTRTDDALDDLRPTLLDGNR